MTKFSKTHKSRSSIHLTLHFLMPSNYKDKKIPNIMVTMSFVDIFIFLKGLLDGKGCILNIIYKCFGIFVTLFSYFT